MNDAVIGFVGVLVGVVATIGKDFVAYWIGRRNSGRYAAVRIVCILDQFAEKCVDVAGDDGTAEGRPAGRTASGEEYYEAQVDPPEPPVFPDDIDWTSISPDLMYRILALPNMALGTERFILAVSEHSFPPGYDELFQARWEGYADLGLEALSIVDALRRKFNLPQSSIAIGNPDWDSTKFLRQKKGEVLHLRAAERASNRALLEELAEMKN
ncbi:hypothetical protein [Novosphingobium subterraneum]|uniref:Uncharacterized protein n=1 Tax=Novosphingobium subterraneum TaxID=48936 RepID=A0A0B8ZHQ1_9SPHN|nr:hypothetical protein [Novosphingobium subterraneum]KHS45834.1 hypothetical protein NJ75_02439 [Novosphingobium subterraneum]